MAVEHDYIKRTAVSDANLQTGRYVLLGTEEPSGVLVSIQPDDEAITTTQYRGGGICRYVDTSNWLGLFKTGYVAVAGQNPQWKLIKRKGGSEAVLLEGSNILSALTLFAGRDGLCKVFTGTDLTVPSAETTTPDVDLIAGGTLGKGKYGVYDAYTSAVARERKYRAFQVVTAATDPVLFASLDARLSSEGHFRRSADNKAYGPVNYPGADLPRIPVSGREERPVEIGLRPSRGDFTSLPDAGLDKVKGALTYRPCYSCLPGD